jgi:hypothetical protein
MRQRVRCLSRLSVRSRCHEAEQRTRHGGRRRADLAANRSRTEHGEWIEPRPHSTFRRGAGTIGRLARPRLETSGARLPLITSLAEYDAATALRLAAHTAYDAALRFYRQGIGTYTDLATEENAVVQGETPLEDARANAHTGAATLAFSPGD